MLLESSLGQLGDTVMLLSPPRNFTSPTLMSFYYHMQLNSSETTAALTVYKYSRLHAFEQQLFMTSQDGGEEWQKASVCLPAGVYSVAFVGTIGLSYSSDTGLDNIDFDETKSPCKTAPVIETPGKSIITVN